MIADPGVVVVAVVEVVVTNESPRQRVLSVG